MSFIEKEKKRNAEQNAEQISIDKKKKSDQNKDQKELKTNRKLIGRI